MNASREERSQLFKLIQNDQKQDAVRLACRLGGISPLFMNICELKGAVIYDLLKFCLLENGVCQECANKTLSLFNPE
jgi:hypothetical protein